MRILLAGASGAVGRRVAAELVQIPELAQLVLTARDKAAAARIASIFGSDHIVAEQLDVTETSRFIALARDVDVVVCAAGPHYLFEIGAVRAAIDAGTSYISLCDDHAVTDRVAALDGVARDAGVTIVSGCGLSPGLTNFLVALAAEDLEDVDEVVISVAASSADTPGAATTLHFLASMAEPAVAISDHTTERTRAGTVPKLVYFPDPVGWVETFRSGHPEVATMPTIYPDLRSLAFRIGLTERAAMDVVRASAAAGLLASEKQRRLWLRVADPLRGALEAVPPRGAPWTSARVDVRGRAGGRPASVSLAVVDHLSNLAAVPVAYAAAEISAGKTQAGVLVPERAFDPKTFLGYVGRRGVRVARLDPVTV